MAVFESGGAGSMVNFVESLFGLAILSVLVAIVLRARGRTMPARWWATTDFA